MNKKFLWIYEHIDYVLFVKKGYLFQRHLIPFLVEALFLLFLSVPQDNLLLKLASALQQPTAIWLPALLLTSISIYIYYTTIKIQVRKSYLWPEGDKRRSVATSVMYFLISSTIVYIVLKSTSVKPFTFENIWACSLISLLSLTGIGWIGPTSWVENTGTKSPDYTEGRDAAKKITNILWDIRHKPVAEMEHLDQFVSAIDKLQKNIEYNINLEPEFETEKMLSISNNLIIIEKQVNECFSGKSLGIIDFTSFCKEKDELFYPKLTKAFMDLGSYWPDWKYVNN